MNELTVNLKNIMLNALQKKASLRQGCRFCAVVKANAYGLGAVRIAHCLKSVVDCFAVARTEELELLRKSGIKTPVLVLGQLCGDEIKRAISNKGEIQVNSVEMLQEISEIATTIKQVAFVHLAFDTGMHRFGFLPSEANEIAKLAYQLKNVCVKGVMSHFAEAQNPQKRNEQLMMFESIKPFFPGVIFHIANSYALQFENCQQDMVRCGIELYLGKHPSVTLRGQVLRVSNLKKGQSCGYDRIYTADEDHDIATISLGYADGIPRSAAGKAEVLINGEKMRIVAVCMDSSIVKIEKGQKIDVGDFVVVFGKNGKNFCNVIDFAAKCGTISYEVMTGVSERVVRKYLFR